jgi:hypothetical protein
MSNAELIAHIKNANPTKNDTEFHAMIDGGRYADAAEYLLKRGIGGSLWNCSRELAGLSHGPEAWVEEAGKIVAARKAKYAKR